MNNLVETEKKLGFCLRIWSLNRLFQVLYILMYIWVFSMQISTKHSEILLELSESKEKFDKINIF